MSPQITQIMNLKIILSCALVVFSATLCVGQAPAKKTGLTTADREAWHKVLRWPNELEEQWRRSRTNNNPEQSGLVFYNLVPGNYLVAIEVQESAYQPRYLFMHYTEFGKSQTPARLLKLKIYERDDDDAGTVSSKVLAEVEGVPTFDAARKQLVIYTKGRGIGDCGSLVRYNITPTRAIPAEARAHGCYDDYSLGITDPMRWPKIRRL